jgi:hypothetical protein
MRNRLLVSAALILLTLLSGCGILSSVGSLNSVEVTPTPQNSGIPPLVTTVDYPHQMLVNHTYIIKVSLTSNKLESAKASPTTNPYTFGTPGVTLQNAFGPGYEAFASATLVASPSVFDIIPASQSELSLKQMKIEWSWEVLPKFAGSQIIDVTIDGIWKPVTGASPSPLTFNLSNSQLIVGINEEFATNLPPSNPLFNITFIVTGLVVLLSLLAGFIVPIFFTQKDAGKLSIEEPKKPEIPTIGDNKLSEVQKVALAQTALINRYYESVLRQAQQSFVWAIRAAGAGLAFFLLAVGFLLFQQGNVSNISLISGALVEVISGINFYLYARASSQLESFHIRLDRTQHFLLANTVCEILEGQIKEDTRAELVRTIANAQMNNNADQAPHRNLKNASCNNVPTWTITTKATQSYNDQE